mgnify:CR=1 FL=1
MGSKPSSDSFALGRRTPVPYRPSIGYLVSGAEHQLRGVAVALPEGWQRSDEVHLQRTPRDGQSGRVPDCVNRVDRVLRLPGVLVCCDRCREPRIDGPRYGDPTSVL